MRGTSLEAEASIVHEVLREMATSDMEVEALRALPMADPVADATF